MKNKENCKYELKDGVYYMKCNGEKIPVDIDAPPKFKANDENMIKNVIATVMKNEKKKYKTNYKYKAFN